MDEIMSNAPPSDPGRKQETEHIPVTTQEQPPRKPVNKKVAIGIVCMFLMVLLVGGYLRLTNNATQDSTTKLDQTVTEITSSPIPSPTIDERKLTEEMIKEWTTKSDKNCNVTFSMPPDTAPYSEWLGEDTTNPINRRIWQIREGTSPGDFHGIFNTASLIMHVADIEASDYISGMVRIRCAPNASYTLENIAEKFASTFESDGAITVRSKKKQKLWNHEVLVAQFHGGVVGCAQCYFVVTNNMIYLIDKVSASDSSFVKATTDQIFSSLEFSKL